jgi:hypothetical protein
MSALKSTGIANSTFNLRVMRQVRETEVSRNFASQWFISYWTIIRGLKRVNSYTHWRTHTQTHTHIHIHTHTHTHTHRCRCFWESHNMSNVCPSLLHHETILNIVLSTWGRFALVMSALAILKQWCHAASLMLLLMSNVFPRPDLFCGKLEHWTWSQASSAK